MAHQVLDGEEKDLRREEVREGKICHAMMLGPAEGLDISSRLLNLVLLLNPENKPVDNQN